MATRSKEEFEQLGYTHASNGDVRSYKSDSTSWQGIAYNAGVKRYNSEAAERAYKARPPGKSVVDRLYKDFQVKHGDIVHMANADPSKPPKVTAVWFDELLHDKPENRWSTKPGFQLWPTGAVAHIEDLKRQLLVSQDPKRSERLQAAIERCKRRHGVPT